MTPPRVNRDRLWSALMEIGRIGETPDGGCRRLALTQEDAQARALLTQWAQAAGCAVSSDAIGNLFLRRSGAQDDAPAVAMGSHLDTVRTGGKFDGVLGVIAGLEALRVLHETGARTRAPVELVVWTNEEGARFSPMTMGSSVFVGDITLDFALAQRDPDGVSVAEALARTGLAGDRRGSHPLAAYLELHVEQGPLLKEGGEAIGVVTGSFRAHYFVASITGEAGHVGPALMEHRRDAFAAAAELTLAIERIGRARGRDGRSNAPHVEVYPNARGVIPASARLSCDVRHADPAEVERMEEELRAAARDIAARRGVGVAVERYFQFGPLACDGSMADLVRRQADALGLRRRDLLTVASHDAVPMMRFCPTALFFVPSETGVSHNPTEFSTPDQCGDGADVLLNAVLELAN